MYLTFDSEKQKLSYGEREAIKARLVEKFNTPPPPPFLYCAGCTNPFVPTAESNHHCSPCRHRISVAEYENEFKAETRELFKVYGLIFIVASLLIGLVVFIRSL